MCSKPSTPGASSTNAPNSVRLRTVPRTTTPSCRCGESFLLGRVHPLFENGAAVHDDVFFRHIQLDDFDFDLLADQLLHLGLIPRAAAGGRHKGGHAHIDPQVRP